MRLPFMSLIDLMSELARTNSPARIGKITAIMRSFGLGCLGKVPTPWNAS